MEQRDSITSLKGIGEKYSALFSKLEIHSIGDLLEHYPNRYECYEEPIAIKNLVAYQINTIVATILDTGINQKFGHTVTTSFQAFDESGQVKITFYHMPFLKKTIQKGETYVIRGTLVEKRGALVFEHPKLIRVEDYEKQKGILQPIYSKTKGISDEILRKYIKQALKQIKLQDHLPTSMVHKSNLVKLDEAIEQIHFPQSEELLRKARQRLSYEEFFWFLLAIHYHKQYEQNKRKDPFIETAMIKRFEEALPFEMTAEQKKAWGELKADYESGIKSNRLLQGDVGCGKTLVAALAMLMCVENGKQTAFMAPTEVLATQHFHTISEYTQKYHLSFRPVLLTGMTPKKQKMRIKEDILMGVYNVVIGTHALIQEDLVFQNLGLVITDEQHRFGVKQRALLSSKGDDVHTLVMSATPIPRTLALILYGDLDISTIESLPSNRLPIKNCVVPISYRSTAYQFIQKQVAMNHQAYIICPMIQSGELDELENVLDYSKNLRELFPPQVRIETLHGKMKPGLKNEIMSRYANREIDILVSTTVIEVGINVPNATVMMIENAQRFGLATLHQLRGRVGRSDQQSYCIFVYSNGENESGKVPKRLEILNQSNDGFEIAAKDLELRGPGELAGTFQSGELAFRFADIYRDSHMLYQAFEDVKQILARDHQLSSDEFSALRRELENGYERRLINII